MKPYCVRLKGGILPVGGVVVREKDDFLVVMVNGAVMTRVDYLHVKEFRRIYEPNTKADPYEALMHMHKNAQSSGCTPAAMRHLSKHTDVPDEWLGAAVLKGKEKQRRHRKEAAQMAAGKAPRKLSATDKAKKALEDQERRDAEKAYEAATQEAAMAEEKKRTRKVTRSSKKVTAKPTRGKPKPSDEPVTKKPAPKRKPGKTKGTPLPAKDKVGSMKKTAAKKPSGKPIDPKTVDLDRFKKKNGDWRSASAMFKALLIQGGKSDKQIFAQVKKKFDLDDNKFSYVQWNRNALRKENIDVGDPK